MNVLARHTYLRPSMTLLLLLTLITGVGYPLLTTGLSGLIFRPQALGSLLFVDGKPMGSALIGQAFTRADYFWGRPSATSDSAYNAMASAGSNLAITNPAMSNAIAARVAVLQGSDPANHAPIPVDLLTASGSGLDPHISVAAANWQIPRIARARQLSPEKVEQLVKENTASPLAAFTGQPVVNVLQLNLALDHASGS